MAVLTAFLFFIFGQYRTGATTGYSAVFNDASRLKTGDSVRVAGIRVGTVNGIALQPDKKVVVKFDADRSVVLTDGTKAAVRYLNLVGDRYLDLVDGPGSTKRLPAGGQIPVDHTAPALDLDLLLGGLKPVVQGLNAHDVNALSSALLQVFQGEGGTLQSLFSKTTSFSNALGDNDQTIQQLIQNLNTVVATLDKDGGKFSTAIDRLQRLVTGLSDDRDTIAPAIDALSKGTASLADLLTNARPPLSGTIEQLSRLAPLLDDDKDRLDAALQKAPKNYRKLVRLGVFGATIPYFICEFTLRGTDLQGKTVVAPWFRSEAKRCQEPDRRALMLKYRGTGLIKAGFIGAVLIGMLILVGLSPDRIVSLATDVRYQALFSEAGGLATGNAVTVSGIKVGTVSDVSLRNGDALVTFTMKGNVPLGTDTTAHIRTGTLLGERVLTLESAGTGMMHPLDVIPISRTGSPYSLTDAVSDFTSYAGDTNTATLNQSLDTLSATLNQIAPQLGPTFDAVTRLSRSLNSRNTIPGRAIQECQRCHRNPVRTQPTGQQAHPQLRRPASGLGDPPTRDRLAVGQHLDGGQAVVRIGARQRKQVGAHAGKAEFGDRDAGKEPRQHQQGTARPREIRDHGGRGDLQHVRLLSVRPERRSSGTLRAVHGLPLWDSAPSTPRAVQASRHRYRGLWCPSRTTVFHPALAVRWADGSEGGNDLPDASGTA